MERRLDADGALRAPWKTAPWSPTAPTLGREGREHDDGESGEGEAVGAQETPAEPQRWPSASSRTPSGASSRSWPRRRRRSRGCATTGFRQGSTSSDRVVVDEVQDLTLLRERRGRRGVPGDSPAGDVYLSHTPARNGPKCPSSGRPSSTPARMVIHVVAVPFLREVLTDVYPRCARQHDGARGRSCRRGPRSPASASSASASSARWRCCWLPSGSTACSAWCRNADGRSVSAWRSGPETEPFSGPDSRAGWHARWYRRKYRPCCPPPRQPASSRARPFRCQGRRIPLTLAAVMTVLLAAGLIACWLPARRAARIDPMEVLRET